MKLLFLLFSQAQAVDYIPHSKMLHNSLGAQSISDINSIEKVLWLLVVAILLKPLLSEHSDPKVERQRVRALTFSGLTAILAIVIHLFD